MKAVLNIPNSLSLLRILMIPVLLLMIINFTPKIYTLLIALYFFTILLDFLDGFIARAFSQETELGKILDPLADKALVLILVIALIVTSNFPLWLAIPIILRDSMILLASYLIYRRSHSVKSSIIIGKITFASLSVLIFIFVIDLNPMIDLEILKRFTASLTMSFLIWSFGEYFMVYKEIKNGRQKNNFNH
jgi:cardiolipin synthase